MFWTVMLIVLYPIAVTSFMLWKGRHKNKVFRLVMEVVRGKRVDTFYLQGLQRVDIKISLKEAMTLVDNIVEKLERTTIFNGEDQGPNAEAVKPALRMVLREDSYNIKRLL